MLFIIDTYSVLYRLFFALPELTSKNTPINAIYGIVKLMIKLTKEYKPKYLVFCVDKGRSDRDKVIKEYKAHRKPTSDRFKQQIPIFYEMANSTGFKVFGIENTEADDAIATLTKIFKQLTQIYILTGDKDLLQLLDNKKVFVLLMKKGITDVDFYDDKKFKTEFGFDSNLYPYYKALVGDSSDNIKGVKGIGPKKAKEIIQKYTNINEYLSSTLTPEDYKIFCNNLEVVMLKYKDISMNLEDLKISNDWYKKQEFINFIKKYNFVSILKEVEEKQLKLF